ncbi:MAG: hypothetical protein ACYTG7_14555 [Planctomycetota bacterium]
MSGEATAGPIKTATGTGSKPLGGERLSNSSAGELSSQNYQFRYRQVITKLISPTLGASNHFGASLVIDGDTIWVGAPGDDTMGENAGAVYGFNKDGRGWRLGEMLSPNDAAAGQAFGSSVALDPDDPSTMVIGSPGDSEISSEGGAVYTFMRDNFGAWVQEEKHTIAGIQAGSRLGTAADIDEDILVAGAPFEDNSLGTGVGNAYVFERDRDGQWEYVEKLTPDFASADAGFGMAIDVDEDHAIVGAPYLGSELIAGSAFIFIRAGENGWFQRHELQSPTSEGQDRFGSGVGLLGDLAAVGSPRDGTPPDSGTAYGHVTTFLDSYEIKAQLGGWYSVEEFTAPNPKPEDRFGGAVLLQNDRLLVGATNSAGKGAAYLYGLVENETRFIAKITAPEGDETDLFGSSLAMDEDTIVVGAYMQDVFAEDDGAVYVVKLIK